MKAIAGMHAIQPPIMRGIFYFSPGFDEVQVSPDVVLLSLRPVELCRVIQGYQFLTGSGSGPTSAGFGPGART